LSAYVVDFDFFYTTSLDEGSKYAVEVSEADVFSVDFDDFVLVDYSVLVFRVDLS
jgi:hypothetical protein